ncbi:carbohydrate ABC transporter permease [Kitasatospora sp. NPDC057015]|uniref:carbohydrate ABC transporter permease n=1 Tax=Kitasatospora sp. NPDC057015 TaxID=3346001 RepID=UPI00363D7450
MSATAHSPLERRRGRIFGPFVAPAVALYTALFIGPTLYAMYTSLTDWDGINSPRWAGVRNYTQLLHDPAFESAFGNTLKIVFGVGAVVFALSFGFLLMLREMRGRRLIRGVIFLPHIVSSVVLAIFWGSLLSLDGLLNQALGHLGIDAVQWLRPGWTMGAVLLALIWINTGYYVTILMAGVDRIPESYYEAARLDGANAWQRFRHVTLPLSWDVTGAAAVLWAITSVKIFEFILAFGGNQGALPPTYQWNNAMFVYGETVGGITPLNQFGYAAASAVTTLAFVAVLVVVLRRLMRREALQF